MISPSNISLLRVIFGNLIARQHVCDVCYQIDSTTIYPPAPVGINDSSNYSPSCSVVLANLSIRPYAAVASWRFVNARGSEPAEESSPARDLDPTFPKVCGKGGGGRGRVRWRSPGAEREGRFARANKCEGHGVVYHSERDERNQREISHIGFRNVTGIFRTRRDMCL